MGRCTFALIALAVLPLHGVGAGGREDTQAVRKELAVHLAQASNRSPYAFVRARFEPGELTDPWAVRFFDGKGREVPSFVWDSVTWEVAQRGRPDWGRRHALAPGKELARGSRDSICAALYLLRHPVAPFGKEKLRLRLYPNAQAAPRRRSLQGQRVTERTAVRQGDLAFTGLPDRLAVSWKDQELFRSAGFEAGGVTGTGAHADPSRPFSVQVIEGLITQVVVKGTTKGRGDGTLGWQCTYWLFPEGGHVGLEGFSISSPAGYTGGEQRLSVWESPAGFRPVHTPTWEAPWWAHQVAEKRFVATHLFHHTPLTVGHGNNPFTTNPEGGGKDPRVEVRGKQLALRWLYALDDPAVFRLFAPDLFWGPHRQWLAGQREVFATGKVASPPPGMTPEQRRGIEEQLERVRWRPGEDWLYRQYVAGVGESAEGAQAALRHVLGAAAGWVDRPFTEQEVAGLVVRALQGQRPDLPRGHEGPLQVLPYLLQPDPIGPREALRESRNLAELTDHHIKSMQTHVARGGNRIDGQTRDERGSVIGEGWIVNPAYHACQMPSALRFLEHFGLPHPSEEYRKALLRYADFSLEHLGGRPLAFDRLRSSFHAHWPNRFVMIVPLMLHAHALTGDPKYARAAKLFFDDLLGLVERNPHGYWAAWSFRPGAAVFDSVYNPVASERGLAAYWAEGQLGLIGRDRAARFVAAQARWLAFSGQLLDTFEAESPTAIRATDHGGHPLFRTQMALYLYDDFGFYRGLVGPLARGQGLDAGHPYGAFLLRWALGIGRGTHWFEKAVEPLPEKKGFRLRLRNGLPWARPTVWLRNHEAGLQPPHQPLVWLQMKEPTWGPLAVLEVMQKGDGVRVQVSHRMRLRLYPQGLRPGGADAGTLRLIYRPAGSAGERPVDGIRRDGGLLEWDARPGEYELRPGGK